MITQPLETNSKTATPMYLCILHYVYIRIYIYIYIFMYLFICSIYNRSPLEDSRLFGPSPWKVLAATNEKNDF